ncbi:MAG: hypothetical protein CM15mV149_230 [uncultured marine virus]|nr:MAG: hypothetical protein CM15mV149_230 [uncultured marine virus]
MRFTTNNCNPSMNALQLLHPTAERLTKAFQAKGNPNFIASACARFLSVFVRVLFNHLLADPCTSPVNAPAKGETRPTIAAASRLATTETFQVRLKVLLAILLRLRMQMRLICPLVQIL